MKPTEEERKKKRRAILDTAADLFLSKGYDATSIAQVISITGGSKETIYRNFGNKENLFAAVVDDMLSGALQPLSELDIHHLELREGLLFVALEHLDVVADKKGIALTRLVFSESQKHKRLGELFYKHAPHQGFSRLAKFLERHQSLGSFSSNDVQVAAEYFWGMLLYKVTFQLCCSVRDYMNKQEKKALATQVVDDFLAFHQSSS